MLFYSFFLVDAVYAIAHAIDNMIKERCKEVPFHECEEIQPSPMGYELLRHIHNVSFVGRQNTSVSNLSKVSSWLNVAKVHTDKKLHNVWYTNDKLCEKNQNSNNRKFLDKTFFVSCCVVQSFLFYFIIKIGILFHVFYFYLLSDSDLTLASHLLPWYTKRVID